MIKEIIERVPFPIGKLLARVPFAWRFGNVYVCARGECAQALEWSYADRERYSVEKFRAIFEYAKENFQCYRKLYEKAGVLDLEVKSLTDIARIPIIDKAWTRKCER